MQQALTYQERSRAFLVKAREYFDAGDFEQASEKAWGAAALMVKAVAQARGENHYSHNQLREFVETLADETGDDGLSDLYATAESLHKNFYENRFGVRTIRRRLRSVEHFVDKAEQLLYSNGGH